MRIVNLTRACLICCELHVTLCPPAPFKKLKSWGSANLQGCHNASRRWRSLTRSSLVHFAITTRRASHASWIARSSLEQQNAQFAPKNSAQKSTFLAPQSMCTVTGLMHVSKWMVDLKQSKIFRDGSRRKKFATKPTSRRWCNKRVVHFDLKITSWHPQLQKTRFCMRCRRHEYVLKSDGGRFKDYETQSYVCNFGSSFLCWVMHRLTWTSCTFRSNLYQNMISRSDAYSKRCFQCQAISCKLRCVENERLCLLICVWDQPKHNHKKIMFGDDILNLCAWKLHVRHIIGGFDGNLQKHICKHIMKSGVRKQIINQSDF